MTGVIQMGDRWRTEFSTTEVAEMVGQSPETVRRRCIDGDFAGAWLRKGRWRIPAKALIPPD